MTQGLIAKNTGQRVLSVAIAKTPAGAYSATLSLPHGLNLPEGVQVWIDDFAAEMRTIDRPDGEGETGCIVYVLDVGPQASTDRLSEELLASDPRNIDSVEWDQQKNQSYFYQ